jgi:hypothetical protein
MEDAEKMYLELLKAEKDLQDAQNNIKRATKALFAFAVKHEISCWFRLHRPSLQQAFRQQ